jgi:hypothetical protein
MRILTLKIFNRWKCKGVMLKCKLSCHERGECKEMVSVVQRKRDKCACRGTKLAPEHLKGGNFEHPPPPPNSLDLAPFSTSRNSSPTRVSDTKDVVQDWLKAWRQLFSMQAYRSMPSALIYMATIPMISSLTQVPTWCCEDIFKQFFKRFLQPTGSSFPDTLHTFFGY